MEAASGKWTCWNNISAFDRKCLILLLVVPWGLPLWQTVAYSSLGSGVIISLGLIFTLTVFFTTIGSLTLLIGVIAGLLFRRYRARSKIYTAFALAGICTSALSATVARQMWERTFSSLAQRSQPLVTAVKQFEEAEGSPPPALQSLVPKYLNVIPGTGIGAYPKYEYRNSSDTAPNSWELSVSTPIGTLNWDQFLYLPEQNYPERGYGGSLEPIGNWAYVHE